MGGTGQSLPLPRYSFCNQAQSRERRSSDLPHAETTNCRQRRSLSAAFSLPAETEASSTSDLININTATEEELMTLPGISRQTARNIVEYRKLIGGFRKIEDLALVSGIGATKLSLIRDELCVGQHRKAASKNSSASSSGIDLSMPDNASRATSTGVLAGGGGGQRRMSSATKVNVNTANVFRLMKVQFVTQTLAENIVTYRDRKGPFRSLDDLLKVKGVKVALFSVVRPFLVLSDETSSGSAADRKQKRNELQIFVDGDDQVNQYQTDQYHMNQYNLNQHQIDQSKINHLNKWHTSQMNHSQLIQPQVNQSRLNLSSSSMHLLQLPDSHQLLEARRRSDPLIGRTRRTLRLGSWNLDHCSLEKAENPGVREIVAMTILENGIDLLAVQDLLDEKALTKLCEELNFLASLNVSNQTGGYPGPWQSTTGSCLQMNLADSRLGFLYRVDGDLKLTSANLTQCSVSGSDQNLTMPVFIKVFQANASFPFCLVNVQFDSSSSTENDFLNWPTAELNDIVKQHLNGQENLPVIFVGFFNAPPDHPGLIAFKKAGYHRVFSSKQFTDISPQNPDGTKCSENLWLDSKLMTNHFTGNAGIVRNNLTSPWIPYGWGWGGLVSSHCLIWAEISLPTTSPSPSAMMLS